MKKHLSLIFVLVVTTGLPAGAQLVFPDATVQSTAGITFDRVKVIHSDGSDTANGTALRNALVAQASSQTADVLLLEPGSYNIGSTALNMVDFVNIQGFGEGTTFVSGTGSVVINGASFMEIRGIQILGSGDASTVILQNGGNMELIDTGVQHNGNGTGANFGVRVINGGSLELIDSEITFFQNGNSGSFVGFKIVGKDGGGEFSEGEMSNSFIEAEDFSGTMTLTAVVVGDGGTTPAMDESVSIEVFGGIIAVEGGLSNTAIFIHTDAFVFISGGCVENPDGAALDNIGLPSTRVSCGAINTLFSGTRGGVGKTIYSQCTTLTVTGAAPIIDSESAVP